MFSKEIKPLEKHLYLSSPTMHGEEMKYVQEAYALVFHAVHQHYI